MNDQHTKVLSEGSKNRLRYAGSRKRSIAATADVYRSSAKRRVVASASSREERVHNPVRQHTVSGTSPAPTGKESGTRTAASLDDDIGDLEETTFATELDVALDRNASEIFSKFHRAIWPLVRSLPEVLHHAEQVVDLLLSYLLSPHDKSGEHSPIVPPDKKRGRFVVNQATTDVLHLIAVFARDLRHELHPYLHTKLLPRIIFDLVNPPILPNTQPIPMDVTIVEAAFRCISYIFRYDADALLDESMDKGKPCLEGLRQYYGITLASKRELIRRLAAETYAPIIRKLKHDSSKKRHLRRVLRALASSCDPQNAAFDRLQTDAVDGIAKLLYHTARGAPGRLHSKSGRTVVATLLDVISAKSEKEEKHGRQLLFAVADTFFTQLCHVLSPSESVSVITTVIASAKECDNDDSLTYLLNLVQLLTAHRDGTLLRRNGGDFSGPLVETVEDLLTAMLERHRFTSGLTGPSRQAVLNLLFSTLLFERDNTGLSERVLENSLRHNLSVPIGGGTSMNVAYVLVRDLIPNYPPACVEMAMQMFGTAVLSTAAETIECDPRMTRDLVHAMASMRGTMSTSNDDSDDVCFLEHSAACTLSDEITEQLLQCCLLSADELSSVKLQETNYADVAARCKSVAFLAAVGGDTYQGTRSEKNYKRASTWLMQVVQQFQGSDSTYASVTVSIAIQSLACLAKLALGYLKGKSTIVGVLMKARPMVQQYLLRRPRSLWALKSVALFVSALHAADNLTLSDDATIFFEQLTVNLRDKNHFCRLHALEILSSFPKRPFVVDHAELDFADDLDEEGAASMPNDVQNQSAVASPGLCTIVDTLLSIESKPANLEMERPLLTMISRVGVLGRSGKLPVAYAEAAAAHMLGLLSIKFAPIWPVAVKALVGLAVGHEACVWPLLHDQIRNSMLEPEIQDSFGYKEPNISRHLDPSHLFALYLSWETSAGNDCSLFASDIVAADEQGRITRHHSTDDACVFESLWSVVAGAPQLVTSHSRTIVPIFIRFIRDSIPPDDPDVRELRLDDVLTDIDCDTVRQGQSRVLKGRDIQHRLKSMLNAFAEINGPQQLYKHDKLLSIFVALLSNSSNDISKAAFSCLLRYKIPYVQPYAHVLKILYEKGKLREALMQLNTLSEADTLVSEHRTDLIPLLARILFGRLAVRAAGSTKDSPGARRNAVLSFLSSFCVSSDELYSFLYLMMRAYVPGNVHLTPVELHDDPTRQSILDGLSSATALDVGKRPHRVHQGFLNLLEAAIKQLGQKVVPFVPCFMSLLVGLCQEFSVKEATKTSEFQVQQDEESDSQAVDDRSGSIRSLCYRRLADIASVVGSGFAAYSQRFWGAIQDSLILLPEMVINAEKCPALLLLLRALSNEKALIRMFHDNEEAVPSVIQCLSESSKPAVVEATLAFIECLLDDNDEGDLSCGCILLQRHVNLLLRQFQTRIHLKPTIVQSRGSNRLPKGSLQGSSTWRRELTILCRVSDLVDTRTDGFLSREDKSMAHLCELLLPFLDSKFGVHDTDRHHVLIILEKMISKLPPECVESHFEKLSGLLGPHKAKPRFGSLSLRKSLASVISTLAATSYAAAVKASEVLTHLCSLNAKRVDEMDYDLVISALSDLGKTAGESSWLGLCTHESNMSARVLMPVVHACFHVMFDNDGVVSRGAFKALQCLVALAFTQMEDACQSMESRQQWEKVLDGLLVPMIRAGLDSRIEAIRRFFILLLRDVVQRCTDSQSPQRHSDLKCIIRDDEPDLDFFLNITHVQVHRRARALQRIRTVLDGPTELLPIKQHTLSSVLLPLATHPIYECKTKIEEKFAAEGVETVGAIAKHLSWKQYSSILWTHLNQFERHPDREKVLIALVCAIVDSFHFDVETTSAIDNNEKTLTGNSVLRALENRIIPKVENLLVKDKLEKKGGMVRSSVVLALLKLIRKLPVALFEAKLPRLLSVVVNALKDRDSNARDIARTSLARIVVEMGVSYLADVLRELATSLTEGFKLHVRNACVHTILLEVGSVYKPPLAGEGHKLIANPKFDECVPALMDLIQQDIFGETQEKRDAQGIKARYVKEAGGSKSAHSLELVASMIYFNPTSAIGTKQLSSSSIHVLVSPMLERLSTPGVTTTEARRVKEGLLRIVAGLLKNPSRQSTQVILFVQATLEMFVTKQEMASVIESMEEGMNSDDDDDETVKPIRVSGQRKPIIVSESFASQTLAVWRPSTLKTVESTKAAHKQKVAEENAGSKVLDGASAPKLTGSRRMKLSSTGGFTTVNEPGTISAVIFGLQLLSPTLKNSLADFDAMATLDPFVPLLTTCACRCRDTEVVLLALRCMGYLFKLDLPSLPSCSKSLSSKTLDLLVSSASQELTQASFKMLTLLIALDPIARGSGDIAGLDGENVLTKSMSMPLDSGQLQVLVSYLQEAIVSSDQHQAAIALIKALMSRRYMSAEFYDIMEAMLEQSVRSPTSKLRDQSAIVFVNYLLNYPLSSERMEQHFNQVLLNISYEYAEGRLSAIGLVTTLLQKLPQPVVEQNCRLFFLPLTMQLVNDDSKDCREAVAKCLRILLGKISTEFLQSLYDYVERWSTGNTAFLRTSLQLFTVFADVPESQKVVKPKKLLELVCLLAKENTDEWEIVYFALTMVEMLAQNFNKSVIEFAPIWDTVIDSLVNSHTWIKLASARLLTNHLHDLGNSESARAYMLSHPGVLFNSARNLCYQLGADEEEQDDDLTPLAVKGLVWTLNVMANHPDVTFETSETSKEKDLVKWVLTRLSNIARAKGTKRRQAVFKCFAAFSTLCGPIVFKHLELMLEPLHRVEIETRNELEIPAMMFKARQGNDVVSEEAQFAKDVLHLIEEKCEPQEIYWKAYAAVTARARDRADRRKADKKIEAVLDPLSAAKRRLDKNDREKNRRKRRVDDRRTARGATAKRQHI